MKKVILFLAIILTCAVAVFPAHVWSACNIDNEEQLKECDSPFPSDKHYEIAKEYLDFYSSRWNTGPFIIDKESQKFGYGGIDLGECCADVAFSDFSVSDELGKDRGPINVNTETGRAHFNGYSLSDTSGFVDPSVILKKKIKIISGILILILVLMLIFWVRSFIDKRERKSFLIIFAVLNIIGMSIFIVFPTYQFINLRFNEKKCEECIKNNECRVFTTSPSTLKISPRDKETRELVKKYYYYQDLSDKEKQDAIWRTDDFKYVLPFRGYKGNSCGGPGMTTLCSLDGLYEEIFFNDAMIDKMRGALYPNILFFLFLVVMFFRQKREKMMAWSFTALMVMFLLFIVLFLSTNVYRVIGECV